MHRADSRSGRMLYITSYAGGSAGHDPVRVAALAKERGLTPNVHLTCVSKTPADVAKFLDDLIALDIENAFPPSLAIIPRARRLGNRRVRLRFGSIMETIAEQRAAGKWPFLISVAVSPFKYLEEDCAYQYLKLEKKIAAGADFAITQLGFDSRKYREMKRYLDERNLKFPVLGNVGRSCRPKRPSECRKAIRRDAGFPPTCSHEFRKRPKRLTRVWRRAWNGPLRWRHIVLFEAWGYAGAYIGGIDEPERIRWIIKRSGRTGSALGGIGRRD